MGRVKGGVVCLCDGVLLVFSLLVKGAWSFFEGKSNGLSVGGIVACVLGHPRGVRLRLEMRPAPVGPSDWSWMDGRGRFFRLRVATCAITDIDGRGGCMTEAGEASTWSYTASADEHVYYHA